VKQGKALYAGVSSYRGAFFVKSCELVKQHGWTPIAIHQPLYNMLDRWIETDLLEYTDAYGVGVIAFSPLAQGRLTNKYIDPANPIPKNSRAADPDGFLQAEEVTKKVVRGVRKLAKVAEAREQTIAQCALSWTLRDPRVTSALIGARTPEQIVDCAAAIGNTSFSIEELAEINDLWLE
jgi:L-glyceraldehyde 3-phosphate reductase